MALESDREPSRCKIASKWLLVSTSIRRFGQGKQIAKHTTAGWGTLLEVWGSWSMLCPKLLIQVSAKCLHPTFSSCAGGYQFPPHRTQGSNRKLPRAPPEQIEPLTTPPLPLTFRSPAPASVFPAHLEILRNRQLIDLVHSQPNPPKFSWCYPNSRLLVPLPS